MRETFTVGSRKSALALWQTNWVIACLRKINPEYDFTVRTFQTHGDQILDVALSKIGDKGLFTKELEEALAVGDIDFAVHSLKDMPSTLPQGLCLGAITRREQAGDVLISRDVSFGDLPQGALVGTSSLRRAAQLLHARPDLQIAPLRGNIQTRLSKLDSEGYDAIVLAAAGVLRLNLKNHITEFLPMDICLPAVGQGAIAVECRSDDEDVLAVLQGVEDKLTRLATTAERVLMEELGGGCQVPIAAFAHSEEGALSMTALVAGTDGTEVIRVQHALLGENVEAARKLGVICAQELRDKGAEAILEDIRL